MLWPGAAGEGRRSGTWGGELERPFLMSGIASLGSIGILHTRGPRLDTAGRWTMVGTTAPPGGASTGGGAVVRRGRWRPGPFGEPPVDTAAWRRKGGGGRVRI